MSINGLGSRSHSVPTAGTMEPGTRTLSTDERITLTRQGLERTKDLDSFVMNRESARLDRAFANAYRQSAAADGVLTPEEKSFLEMARRDEQISGLKVQLDEAMKSLGELEVLAARDSRLTPEEGQRLNEARAQVDTLLGTLRRLGRAQIDAKAKEQWMKRQAAR